MGGKIAGDGKRYPRKEAMEVAMNVCGALRECCERVEIAGSLRRGKPDCGDIDICVIPKGGEPSLGIAANWVPPALAGDAVPPMEGTVPAIAEALNELLKTVWGPVPFEKLTPHIEFRKGKFKPRLGFSFGVPIVPEMRTTENGEGGKIQVDVLIAARPDFEAQWLFQTGSADFNVRQRGIAKALGLKLSNYGLMDPAANVVVARTEREIFEKLGMEFLEPEKRD